MTLAKSLLDTINELLGELEHYNRYDRPPKTLAELIEALEATVRLYRTAVLDDVTYPAPPTIRHAFDTGLNYGATPQDVERWHLATRTLDDIPAGRLGLWFAGRRYEATLSRAGHLGVRLVRADADEDFEVAFYLDQDRLEVSETGFTDVPTPPSEAGHD